MPRTSAAALRDVFLEQGYLIFDPGIPKKTLERAVIEMAPLYGAWKLGDGPMRIQDAWRRCPSVRALALHGPVAKMLRVLYEREPLPFQTLNFPVGTQQPVHSDTIHF